MASERQKKVFCSIDNQEKPLKVTGYFIFHQAVFKVFNCSVLFFFFFLHCGTYMQLCLIAYNCTVVSLHSSCPIYVFPLYAWRSSEKCFLNCIKFVYCKLCLTFFSLIKKVGLKNAIEYCNLYSVMDGFFHQTDLLCYQCGLSPFPKVYLIFAFFAQCLWLQVISLRQIKFQ